MSFMNIGIVIAGILSLALAVFHIPRVWQYVFPDWKREIEKTGILNRKLANTVLMALTVLLLVFASISLIYADELSQGEGLAAGIAVAYSLFWLWRLIWQAIYFKPSKAEHGLKLLLLHYSLIVIFAILFIVYLAPTASKLGG